MMKNMYMTVCSFFLVLAFKLLPTVQCVQSLFVNFRGGIFRKGRSFSPPLVTDQGPKDESPGFRYPVFLTKSTKLAPEENV